MRLELTFFNCIIGSFQQYFEPFLKDPKNIAFVSCSDFIALQLARAKIFSRGKNNLLYNVRYFQINS